VLSRETWPTKRSVWVFWISASCSREGKALLGPPLSGGVDDP